MASTASLSQAFISEQLSSPSECIAGASLEYFLSAH